jgi:transcriptional regulator with XRE-family HTH domain
LTYATRRLYGERMHNRNLPHTADIYVGARIRERRLSRGMSQFELAKSVGITFQQIQKYENGTNRVAMGRLLDIAEALDVPLGFFHDELLRRGCQVQAPSELDRERLELMRSYERIPDAGVRASLRALIKALVPPDPAAAA